MPQHTILFTECKPWEQQYITERLNGTLRFTERHLAEVPDKDLADVTIFSPFVHSKVDPSELARMPKLQHIATRSTGFDHLDLAACAARQVTVSNVPFYGENTVAEHALALILALSRKIIPSVERTRRGDFRCDELTGFDLKGKTLGVVGAGHIGTHLIRYASALGMRVLAYSKVTNDILARELGFAYTDLDRLFAESDVISVHTPLMPETTHLLNDAAFKKMKKGVVIVNTARGGIIDTQALVRALQNGTVAAAGLDVIEEETAIIQEREHADAARSSDQLATLLADHVLIGMDNVIMTPHNAFNSTEALERILQTSVENVKAFVDGTPTNLVTPS